MAATGLTQQQINAKKTAINGHLDQTACHGWYNLFGSNNIPGNYTPTGVVDSTGTLGPIGAPKKREKGVNRTHLNAGATTAVAQLGSVDASCRSGPRRGRAAKRPMMSLRARSSEALKQFLQNEPSSHDNLVTLEGVTQRAHLRGAGILVAPESKRPDAGVDEQHHLRDRSAL